MIYFEQAKAALIGVDEDQRIHVGGSYALTQKWKHNLIEWEKQVSFLLMLTNVE